MSVKDVAGVFGRPFVVGQFLPAFFALVVLDLALSERGLPSLYTDLKAATQLLVLGGIGLLLGLLLSGLQYPIIRFYEGYPLVHLEQWPVLGSVCSWLLSRRHNEFRKLRVLRRGAKPAVRNRAAHTLARFWPPKSADLLPTRFGNAVRAFEEHPWRRYRLDGVVAWPRIAALLSDRERENLADAQTDVAFFINVATLASLVEAWVVLDAVLRGPGSWYLLWLYAVGPTIAYLSYRAAVGAAERWGQVVRACFDLHRLELYVKLGLRSPATDEDERAIARAVGRSLLYGKPFPDELRQAELSYSASPSPSPSSPSSSSSSSSSSCSQGSLGSPGK